MKQQILVDHVSKSDILHDISFKISLNEKIAIVGPNGAGKSTLLKLIVGLSMPTKGRILTSCRQSMVFQNNLLDKKLSIAQNLRIRLNKEAIEQAESLLTQFGIKDFLIKYEDLSGGQKRVVNLVRASVTHPEMLILDELSAGMDTQIRESVWRFLSELSSQRKMSIIYTTHILDELFYADKILFINKGRVGYFGDATDFRGKLPAYKLTVNNKDHLFESSEDAIEYIINQNMQKEQFEIRRVSYNDLFKYMEDVFDDQIN